MPTIVQKYGGTSVGDAERIKSVAERVVARGRAGDRVCVVVSAMGDSTDELVASLPDVSTDPHARELDMLLTAGERISMALLSMAIIDLGREAISLHRLAGRHRHRHDSRQGQDRRGPGATGCARGPRRAARSRSSPASRASRPTDDVTTLGRGGSDTTAVALAAALGADAARSTPTSTASSRPIRASCPRRASCTRCRTRRCSSWRRAGAGC